MKINKVNIINEDKLKNDPEFIAWRGVSAQELKEMLKTQKVIPSSDLMPLDWEVVEYGLGDNAGEMSEEQIEDWVKDTCHWYDGSLGSISGGVNATSDFENAKGYGDFVVAIGGSSDFCHFSDSHIFIKSANECRILGYIKSIE